LERENRLHYTNFNVRSEFNANRLQDIDRQLNQRWTKDHIWSSLNRDLAKAKRHEDSLLENRNFLLEVAQRKKKKIGADGPFDFEDIPVQTRFLFPTSTGLAKQHNDNIYNVEEHLHAQINQIQDVYMKRLAKKNGII